MALLTSHNLGSNFEGADGASSYGTPVDNGDFYTFNGADGLYYGSDWGDETAYRLFNATTFALKGRVAEDPRSTATLHQVIDGVCTRLN